MQGDWQEVINIYTEHPEAHTAKITRSGDTALHVAVADGQQSVVEELVSVVDLNALQTRNELGNSPLHVAAYLGNVRMCQSIATRDWRLMGLRNQDGETPFFLAVFHGRMGAFLCLHSLCAQEEEAYAYCLARGGETILHSAISGEYLDMAFQIIHLYPKLVNSVNEQGFSPLHILATKPSLFRSGSDIKGFAKPIYRCLFVDRLKLRVSFTVASDPHDIDKNAESPENYRTCEGILRNIGRLLLGHSRLQQDEEYPNDQQLVRKQVIPSRYEDTRRSRKFFPGKYSRCFHFLKSLATMIFGLLGVGSILQVVNIREKKEKHIWSMQIMEELLKHASLYEYDSNERNLRLSLSLNDSEIAPYALVHSGVDQSLEASQSNEGLWLNMEKMESPILVAARNGIQEMVAGILEFFPVAIHDTNIEKKNIVLLAVENRQPDLYKFLLGREIMKDSIFRKTDRAGNSALHLASLLGVGNHLHSLIPGAALQMQWEIKWYEFVKNSMPLHFFPWYNKDGKTPEVIFSETHKELAAEGGEWLTYVSQSCSIVATLIATVSFSTSTTVPGGVQDDSGSPTLESQPAFTLFGISSLVALYSSVASVVMFLAILISRKHQQDFGKVLPRKLLVGLTCLFVSLAAMLVSFCAAHFIMMKDKMKSAAFPVYAGTCLPIIVFVVVQFPMYFDLFLATIVSTPKKCYK